MFRIPIFMFVMFSSYSVMVFFLPLYFSSKGLDAAQIGQIIGWGSFISMVAQPFWGVVSDRKKTVKGVLIAVLIVSVLLAMGMFSAESAILIGLLYVCFMFFYSPTSVLSETLCVAYAYSNNKEFGALRLWGEIGVGLSALGLGFLVSKIGLSNIYIVFAVMMGAAIFAALFLTDAKTSTEPVNLRAFQTMFKQKKLLWFLLLVLMMGIPHRMNDAMLALHLDFIGGSEAQIGIAWAIAALSTIPMLFFAGAIIRRFGELRIFILAAVIYIGRWIIVSMAASPEVLITVQILQGVTFPFFLVSAVQYIQNLAPPQLRATAMAAFAVTFVGFGGLLGSAGGGYLFERYGPGSAYGFGTVLVAVCLLLAAGTYFYNRKHEQAAAPAGK